MKQAFLRGAALAVIAVAVALGVAHLWSERLRVMAEHVFHEYVLPPLTSFATGPDGMGDGGLARNLLLCSPVTVAEDAKGNVYIADRGTHFRGGMIWKVDPSRTVHAIAGTGHAGSAADGTPARMADLGTPQGLAIGSRGRLYFADGWYHAVWRIEPDGHLTRIAGTGEAGYSGDGGPAREAALDHPADIAIDARGRIYIADVYNHAIRMITPDGIIHTVAGTGEPGYNGDGGPAVETQLHRPWGITIDNQGRLLIADSKNHIIRRVDANGIIHIIAGTGREGYSGDGGPALSAAFNTPQALAVDRQGRIYIDDEHNHAIRVIGLDGTVSTLMGTGEPGYAPPGTPIAGAPLNDPEDILIRPDGSIFVVEDGNHRVIRLIGSHVEPFAGQNRHSEGCPGL